MLIDKSKQSILLKSCKYFPAGKIHKRPPTSCKNFAVSRPGILTSVQKIQIVTSSNFVVRKHKPIANPFNEFSFSSQKGAKKEEICKTKLRSLNSLRCRMNFFSSKRVSLLNTTSKLETKRKEEQEVISGWD
jgi:hypothetical protein